jgi:hypothetical protein
MEPYIWPNQYLANYKQFMMELEALLKGATCLPSGSNLTQEDLNALLQPSKTFYQG